MFDHSCTRRKWLLALAAGALATFTAAQTAYAQGTWTTLASLPAPTEGMTVAGVGNINIATFGSSGGDTNLTRLYNTATDSWSSGTTAGSAAARSEAAYGETTHGGFLYVIGGVSSGTAVPDVQRYDPVTDTWTALASMPTARAGAAAAALDNSIFVIGGRLSADPCSGGPYVSTVERYDIDTDTWTTVAHLPSARSDLAAVAHGGKIYVFGGCAGAVTDEVDMYDPQTNTWTTGLTPMPTPRASLAAGHSGQSVYLIGGWNGATLDVNEVYNISGNSWSTNAPMPTARLKAGTHSHGGRIYVVGGATAFGVPSGASEMFKP